MVKKDETKVLKYKVVTITEYIEKARKLFGDDDVWNNAIALLYTENKVMAIINKKGEDRFLVEV